MSRVTTDHQQIRRWAEARRARPAAERSTHEGDHVGIIRIEFPDYGVEDELEEISWDLFFERFEEGRFAFVYQEETADGKRSDFNKLVRRDPEDSSPHR